MRFDQAIDFYTQEIKANPGNSGAWRERGLIWKEKKDYDKAIADFNEAIRLDPKLALAYNNRGNAWSTRRSTTRPSPTTTKRSGSIPEYAAAYNDRGTAWMPRRTTTRPSPTTTRPSGSIPKHAIAYNNRGDAWTRQEGLRQGHRRLQRGHPARSQVRSGVQQPGQRLAGTRRTTTRPSPTTARPSGSIPSMPSPTTTEARLAGQEGLRQGHRRLQRGHPARSGDRTRLQQPGQRLAGQERATTRPSPTTTKPSGSIPRTPSLTTTGALPGTTRRTTTGPSPTTTRPSGSIPRIALAYNDRGGAWYYKQDYDKAIADFNEAIRLDSGFAPAYNNRGNAWRVRKNYDMAIADYNEAIRLDRTFAPAYQALARLWATCPEESFRDGKRAVELATRACGLAEWKDANMLATLAAAYAEVGKFDKAVEWEEKAIQLYANADDRKKGEERLKLYKDKKPYRETE